jgi:hypothetical protein
MTELEKSARRLRLVPDAPAPDPVVPTIDFDDWLRLGMDNGFVGPPICETHDGTPTSEAEDDEFDDGDDPCIHVLRLYRDAEVKAEVERNHSPSVWRRTNMN